MTDALQNFLTIFIILLIIASILEPETNQSDIIQSSGHKKIVYERDIFTLSGEGVTEIEACNDSASNANNECPYGAIMQSKAKVKWSSRFFSNEKYWSCEASYICKGK